MAQWLRRWRWQVACAVVLVWAVAMTIGLVVVSSPRAVQSGSWAEWATAGVTLLALAAAVWAGVSTAGQLAVMRAEASTRQTESVERQARLVFPLHIRAKDPDGTRRHLVVIENRSDEPVTDLVAIFVGPGAVRPAHVGTVPPGGVPSPGLSEVVEEAVAELARQANGFEWLADEVEFDFPLLFTDARGVRWHRMPDSRLVQRPHDYSTTDAQNEALATSRFV